MNASASITIAPVQVADLLAEAGVYVKTVSERLGRDYVQTTLDLTTASRLGSLLTTPRTPTTAVPAEN
ncbi:MAG: hypothetical protein E6I12_02055 [Chloroflexi bacterium]|nr:MAG: hypothetical protein E6I12_02055 [Chloroflexota bacterium]TMF80429.1 MAG: hypothetical protein E6I15_00390 [Chloroflexota bacterium]TMF90560.1 MAG: hypothetical protein E6I05_15015 [Chloroflexota bacterium]TMG43465.1 MAG: hypothetical protein E6H85_10765 [Chloroflexota bacterium]